MRLIRGLLPSNRNFPSFYLLSSLWKSLRLEAGMEINNEESRYRREELT